jgi:DNA adenine methylase
MAIYKAIKSNPHAVADALDSIPTTSDAYYKLRSIDPETLELEHRAARLIFLMKSCFNGVYRTNRQGKFNVPMGTRIYALPSRDDLVAAQTLLSNAELIDGDFERTLAQTGKGDWIYMDPPYRQPGRYRGEYGYEAEFGDERMAALVASARRMAEGGRQVMLSYNYDERLIREFSDWTVHEVKISRTVASAAGARREAREIIMTSYVSQ